MSQYFSIAEYFFKQNRYKESLEQVKKGLLENPENSFLLAFQGLCQLKMRMLTDAEQSVNRSLDIDPNSDFTYYIKANIALERAQFKQAEKAIQFAIDINPISAEYIGIKALCMYNRHKNIDEIRTVAKTGLNFDPNNSVCRNVLSMVELRVGKKKLATNIMNIQLEQDPNNSLSLTNQGWNHLHQGNYQEAETFFNQALEHDSSNDWARTGLLQVFKTKMPLYRYILKFFLALSRLSPMKRFGIIFGVYLVFAVLTRSDTALGLIAGVVFFAYAGFIYLTWLWESLANVVLANSKSSKHLVKPIEKRNSYLLSSVLLIALGFGVSYLFHSEIRLIMASIGCFLLSIPLTITLQEKKNKKVMGSLICICLLFCFGAFGLLSSQVLGEVFWLKHFTTLIGSFLAGVLALTGYLFFTRTQ